MRFWEVLDVDVNTHHRLIVFGIESLQRGSGRMQCRRVKKVRWNRYPDYLREELERVRRDRSGEMQVGQRIRDLQGSLVAAANRASVGGGGRRRKKQRWWNQDIEKKKRRFIG